MRQSLNLQEILHLPGRMNLGSLFFKYDWVLKPEIQKQRGTLYSQFFGNARINLLTPSGLYFGQGPFEALMKDQFGGPVLVAATELIQQLIKVAKTLSHASRFS
jgi:hypothetical protein